MVFKHARGEGAYVRVLALSERSLRANLELIGGRRSLDEGQGRSQPGLLPPAREGLNKSTDHDVRR